MVRTLGDYARRFRLHATCEVCKLSGAVDLEAAMRRLGKGAELSSLEGRLVCSACGSPRSRAVCGTTRLEGFALTQRHHRLA